MDPLSTLFGRLNVSSEEHRGAQDQGDVDITAMTDLHKRLRKALLHCSQNSSGGVDAKPQRLDQRVAELSKTWTAFEAVCKAVSSWKSSAIETIWTTICQEDRSEKELLAFFEQEIKKIVTSTLENSVDHEDALRTILELCYGEAYSSEGRLHSQRYFDVWEEPTLEFLFDARETARQSWVDFWLRKLEALPQGPTFFRSLALTDEDSSLKASSPRCLFRVFDRYSSGQTDDLVVASLASISGYPQVDLTRVPSKEAAERIVVHLKKSLFNCGTPLRDNLMSWTSSLLFVIQYAIYRLHKKPSLTAADVKLCVIDLHQFPHGQFARDTWLIEQFYKQNDELEELRRVRQMYDNGEYLSQGTVSHEERSCVCSLQDLIDAGLYDLYSEFRDPYGKDRWTIRAEELRTLWAQPQTTEKDDLRLAMSIARRCFKGFDTLDISLLVLSLKNRVLKVESSMDNVRAVTKATREPMEVQRYLEWSSGGKRYHSDFAGSLRSRNILQKMFGNVSESDSDMKSNDSNL